MNDFEDALRRELDGYAGAVEVSPDAWDRNAELLAGRSRRTRRRVPLMIAAAVAVLVAGVSLVVGSLRPDPPPAAAPAPTAVASPSASPATSATPGTPGPVACPEQVETSSTPGDLWVPSPPVEQPDRLVPADVPVRALTCTYRSDSGTGVTVKTGPVSTELTGDLAPLVENVRSWPTTLPGQDFVCSLAGSSGYDDALLALTYESGATIWIAGQTHGCWPIGNGIDSTPADRVGQLLASARAGHWVTTEEWVADCPDDYDCSAWEDSRWGQQLRMIPDQPATVEVTRSTMNDQEHPAEGSAAASQELIDAFNKLPGVRPATGSCESGPEGADATLYTARFGYPSGPSVLIHIVTGCDPAVGNGSIAAVGEQAVTPLLDQILTR